MAHKSQGPKVTEVCAQTTYRWDVKMWSGNIMRLEAMVTFSGTVTQSGHKQGRLWVPCHLFVGFI